jgi:hypothetical protein
MIAGGAELAERIGISMKVFERLAIEGVMVRVSRGRYLVFGSIQNYVRELTNAASGRDGGATGQARARRKPRPPNSKRLGSEASLSRSLISRRLGRARSGRSGRGCSRCRRGSVDGYRI